MKPSITFSACIALVSAFALPGQPHSGPHNTGSHGHGSWDLKSFSALVAFGDSYSDDSRFAYFFTHNESAPPVGWYTGGNSSEDDGARIYNYAVNGAACSNDYAARYLVNISGNYPDVEHYEIPAWIADKEYITPEGEPFLDIPADETVYSMWIGTNELDVNGFLTDSQVPGTNITTYTDCVYAQLDRIYENGGRYFVLQNVNPLFLTPLVATPENGGVGPNVLWPDKSGNLTAYSYKMMEMVVGVNEIFEYRTPFEVLIAGRYPGARFAVMRMYDIIMDIYNNPTEYLNGSAPANVTGYIHHCAVDNLLDCEDQESPDSYLWYDASHPSEQTNRIIARNFVDVVKGKSKYATYWSS